MRIDRLIELSCITLLILAALLPMALPIHQNAGHELHAAKRLEIANAMLDIG